MVERRLSLRTIAAGIPGAELLTLPDVGYFPYAEAPEAFTAAVARFLHATRA
jgi:pimeloyl-ACP methyl ester carboxylesterase